LNGEASVSSLRGNLIGGAIIVGCYSLIGITSDVRLITIDGSLIYGGLIIVGLVARARNRVRVGIIPRGYGRNILLIRGRISLGVDLTRVALGVEIGIPDFPL
jgi:hypothetical protein